MRGAPRSGEYQAMSVNPPAPPETSDAARAVPRAAPQSTFPQAFSHLALIQAAARIILAERLAEISVG
jgi:hypothetical protein